MAEVDARVALMRELQSRGAGALDITVSLLGDYREDDDRKRWRVVARGLFRNRTYSGRTLEEALDTLLSDMQEPVESCPDPFPSRPPYR